MEFKVSIDVPEGATHVGKFWNVIVLSELTFYKSAEIGGFLHWFIWDEDMGQWMFDHSNPDDKVRPYLIPLADAQAAESEI
ncbi:hypothetical protein Gekk315_00071 [Aeromonas phage Gekk3-15]